MSRHVYGYTEAKIDGRWYCIDFYQYDMDGRIHHIPCIQGQSIPSSSVHGKKVLAERSAGVW